MKIVTWNVNGIRSFDGKWKEVMESFDADIICVQETKVTSKFRKRTSNLLTIIVLRFLQFLTCRIYLMYIPIYSFYMVVRVLGRVDAMGEADVPVNF